MSTKTPDLQKGIEKRAESMGVFGIDASGARHRYDPVSELLVVTDADGDVEYTKGISHGLVVDQWIPFVAGKRGWIDQWFDEDVGLFEARARRLAAAETFRAPEDRE